MANSVKYTGGQFHKLLDKFADGVNHGTYRKVSYDMYRKLRKVAGEVKVSYKLNNGVYSAHVRDGDIIHSFPASDEDSFGYFLLKEVNKEANMHSDGNKTEYDIFGNVNYSNSIAGVPCDGMLTNVGSGYGWGDYNIDTLSTNCSTSVKTIAEVAKEEADRANNRIDEIEVDLKYEISDAKMTAEHALLDVSRKVDISQVVELEDTMREVTEKCARELKALRDEIYAKLATKQDITFEYNLDGVMAQSTSSNVYPLKNYNIDIKADYMSGSDNRKENENMDTNKMFNFDFGPVASNIRMSPYGMAMKNADGKYVSYDKASGNIVDVEILNFDAQKFLYKMPVAVNAVAVGDIVVHMRKAMFVSAVNGNRISVVDIYNGEVKDIMPTTSPFGFNFITKVVSLIDMSGANTDSPFGNMLPFLMMGEGRDFKDILPLMLLTNGNTNFAQNPLMLYALMGDGNMNDILPFMFMMGNNPFAPAAPAQNCGCPNHANHNDCTGDCHH